MSKSNGFETRNENHWQQHINALSLSSTRTCKFPTIRTEESNTPPIEHTKRELSIPDRSNHRINTTEKDVIGEWEAEFAALVNFRDRYGHLNVPKEEKELFRFVKNTKQNYHYHLNQKYRRRDSFDGGYTGQNHDLDSSIPVRFQSESSSTWGGGRKSGKYSLTFDRIQRLEAIGFTTYARKKIWMTKYEQLKTFWEEHGHTNLPSDEQQYKSLKSWVSYQRKRYRESFRLAANWRYAPLSQEEIQLLEDIQFCWYPHDDVWWKRFRELETFLQENNGSFAVSRDENAKLRGWRIQLRRQCREYVMTVVIEGTTEGVHVTGLNPERLEALRRIRFCWLPPATEGPLIEMPPEDIFFGYQ